MISYIRFVFSKAGLKHIIMAGAVLLILFFLLFAWMASYTDHGDLQVVPDLTGMDFEASKALLEKQGLRCKVEDSLYVPEAVPGSIISQSPEHFTKDLETGEARERMVKTNRVVYCTIASYLPPKVEMPDLVGMSKRAAINILGIIGIEIQDMEYVPDEVCTDCVLKQTYNGAVLKPGTKLYKGEKVSLVLGKQSAQYVSVPDIKGYSYADAKTILNRVSLNMGAVYGGCEDCYSRTDTMNAFILRQDPEERGNLSIGGEVSVYLTTDRSLIEDKMN
ncbi:MAG: PASTA domain-containing protein [Bacteroidetes bacterium]|jgi:eukaryotic-like serine/threonine-protein kinase|nr:PASTA domain-containing protein [Bacteroidota bacterium]